MLADLMASTFINDPLRRQEVLEERVVNQRLRLIIRYLGEEFSQAYFRFRLANRACSSNK